MNFVLFINKIDRRAQSRIDELPLLPRDGALVCEKRLPGITSINALINPAPNNNYGTVDRLTIGGPYAGRSGHMISLRGVCNAIQILFSHTEETSAYYDRNNIHEIHSQIIFQRI